METVLIGFGEYEAAALILFAAAFVWLGPAFISAAVASNKGRSGVGFFLLGLLFSWFTAIFAVLAGPSIEHRLAEEERIRRMREKGDGTTEGRRGRGLIL